MVVYLFDWGIAGFLNRTTPTQPFYPHCSSLVLQPWSISGYWLAVHHGVFTAQFIIIPRQLLCIKYRPTLLALHLYC